jgi:hypothetical protein
MLDRARFVETYYFVAVVQLDGTLLRINHNHQRRTGSQVYVDLVVNVDAAFVERENLHGNVGRERRNFKLFIAERSQPFVGNVGNVRDERQANFAWRRDSKAPSRDPLLPGLPPSDRGVWSVPPAGASAFAAGSPFAVAARAPTRSRAWSPAARSRNVPWCHTTLSRRLCGQQAKRHGR